MKKLMTLATFLGIILLANNVEAQAKKDPKRTVIDFEDELVEGQADKPELFYLLQKRQFNYKKMIRLRENFLPELRRTSEEIQRSGSSN
jgi:hypothetical protein